MRTLYFCPVSSSSSFFPRLISAAADSMSTILPWCCPDSERLAKQLSKNISASFELTGKPQWEIFCLANRSLTGHGPWCGPSANLECRSERCGMRLPGNAGPEKSPTGHNRTICRAISSQLKHVSTIGKKLVKQQCLPSHVFTVW